MLLISKCSLFDKYFNENEKSLAEIQSDVNVSQKSYISKSKRIILQNIRERTRQAGKPQEICLAVGKYRK